MAAVEWTRVRAVGNADAQAPRPQTSRDLQVVVNTLIFALIAMGGREVT